MIAALNALWRMDEARVALRGLEAVDPGCGIAKAEKAVSIVDGEARGRYLSALVNAGVPLVR